MARDSRMGTSPHGRLQNSTSDRQGQPPPAVRHDANISGLHRGSRHGILSAVVAAAAAGSEHGNDKTGVHSQKPEALHYPLQARPNRHTAAFAA